MTIKQRLILIVLAAVILPMAVTTIIAVLEFRSSAEKTYRHGAEQQMIQINQTFETYLNGMAQGVTFLSKTDALKALDDSVANYFGPKGPMTPEQNSPVEREAWQLMEDYGTSNPDLMYVYLGLENGDYIQWPKTPLGEYNPTKRPWYQASINEPAKPVTSAPYEDFTTGDPLVPYMHSFKTDSGLDAVIAMDITLGKLTEIVRTVTFGDSGYLILIDQTGVVLADPVNTDNNFKKVADLGADYQGMTNGALDHVTLNGQDWLVMTHSSDKSGWKMIGLIPASEVFAAADAFQIKALLISLVLLAVFGAVGLWFSNLICRPINAMAQSMEEIANGEGDLTKRLPENGSDELSQLAGAFNRFVAMIHQLVKDISATSLHVANQSDEGANISQTMATSARSQSDAMEQVSVAFNQMVQTAAEVARNCTDAAGSADQSQEYVNTGQQYIDRSVTAVESLTRGIEDSNRSMETLANESRNITTILETIRGIAEQTNLLALNAAIEAARAGDQGRGFAVVADEVRTLAGRTADSTAEIDSMIASLTSQTAEVAGKLENTLKYSEQSMKATEQTRQVFTSIQDSVSTIRDMAQQIAAAAEEQQQVSEVINRNIVEVNQESTATQDRSVKLHESATNLKHEARSLTDKVIRFKV
jgi:methyl-accepting chemotaxis protein